MTFDMKTKTWLPCYMANLYLNSIFEMLKNNHVHTNVLCWLLPLSDEAGDLQLMNAHEKQKHIQHKLFRGVWTFSRKYRQVI